jgi:hypothetical protein
LGVWCASRWSGLRRRRDPGPKPKPSMKGKTKTISAPRRRPASRRSALSRGIRFRIGKKPRLSDRQFPSGTGRSGIKTLKPFHERKTKNHRSSEAQSPPPAGRCIGGPAETQSNHDHTQKENTRTEHTVVSGRFSGSLTVGNENPFQAHSVLESSSDFRLILRLENAIRAMPPDGPALVKRDCAGG